MVVPDGKRALTIPVDAVTGVADLIRPGNKVDVLVTLEAEYGAPAKTVTLFQNVLVLAVRDQIIGAQKLPDDFAAAQAEMGAMPAEVTPTVTLSLTPGEAQSLSHALGAGVVRLSVRGLDDNATAAITPSMRSSLR
ncbi:MAG: hypothetical protein DDT19_02406 [Syntrophomonadaceae bacterium]|nr:hypothetical protein [Bacillota bacterium]